MLSRVTGDVLVVKENVVVPVVVVVARRQGLHWLVVEELVPTVERILLLQLGLDLLLTSSYLRRQINRLRLANFLSGIRLFLFLLFKSVLCCPLLDVCIVETWSVPLLDLRTVLWLFGNPLHVSWRD